MENQITCPYCQRIVSNNPIINDAAERTGSGRQFLICECGERITYWQIVAQLRDQKKIGSRIKIWFRGLVKSQN